MPSGKECLNIFVEAVQDCFDAHTAALFVADPLLGQESVRLEAVSSLSPKIIQGATIEPGQGLLGWSLKEQEFLHATDFRRDTRTLGLYAEDVGIKALMVAPTGTLGLLMVDSRSQFAFSQKKQGQFRRMAAMGEEMIRSYIHSERLGLWERLKERFFDLSEGGERAIEAVLHITRLDVGAILALRNEYLHIEAVLPKGAKRMNELFYKELKGLGTLIFKHNRPIITSRFKVLGHGGKGQERGLGPTVVAIPFQGQGKDGGVKALIASGKRDLKGWSKGLEFILADLLKKGK